MWMWMRGKWQRRVIIKYSILIKGIGIVIAMMMMMMIIMIVVIIMITMIVMIE